MARKELIINLKLSISVLILTILTFIFFLVPVPINSFSPLRTYTNNTCSGSNSLEYISISSDGSNFIAKCQSSELRGGLFFYNALNSEPLWNSDLCIHTARYSDNGNYIVYTDRSGTALLGKSSSTPIWTNSLGGSNWGLNNYIEISSNGYYFIVGDKSNLYFYNRTSSSPTWSTDIGGFISDIAMSDDGYNFVVGRPSPTSHVPTIVYFFNKSSSTPEWSAEIENKEYNDYVKVSINPDGDYIAACSNKRLYYYNRIEELWNIELFEEDIDSLSISPDGKYILVGTNKNLYLFENSTRDILWSYPSFEWGMSAKFSGNGKYIIAGIFSDVILFNLTDPNPLWVYSAPLMINSVDISENGSLIIAIDDENVYLFELNNFYIPDYILKIFIEVPIIAGIISIIYVRKRFSEKKKNNKDKLISRFMNLDNNN